MNSRIVLDTVNVLTDPTCFNIFQIISKKPASYTELASFTQLSTHKLSKNLEQLLQHSLIKTDLSKTDDGKFTAYKTTALGKKFQTVLHDMMLEFDDSPQEVTGKFVLDSSSFAKLIERYTIQKIRQIFRNSNIIFTDSDFIKIVQFVEDKENEELEDFLYDDNMITIAKTYDEPKSGSRTEFYLRRAKKLPQDKSQIVATALDRKAGIVSDDEKLIKYSRQLGVLAASIESILELDGNAIREEFFDLANKKNASNPMEVINPQYYSKALKKN